MVFLFNNIDGIGVMGEIVGKLLGPTGGYKMLVDGKTKDVEYTIDPAIMLDKMFRCHPSRVFLTDAGLTVKREVGDGVTSTLVLLSALLTEGKKLIQRGVHPSTLSTAYVRSLVQLTKFAQELSFGIDPTDPVMLRKVVFTACNKIPREYRGNLSSIIAQALLEIGTPKDGGLDADIRALKLSKQEGGSIADTILVQGVATPMDILDPGMPRRVENTKVLLLNTPLQVVRPKYNPKVVIESIGDRARLDSVEDGILQKMTNTITGTGAKVVMCQQFIDEEIATQLAREGVIAVRFVSEFDMECLAKATGAKVTDDLASVDESVLGYAGLVEQREVENMMWLFFERIPAPKSLTVLIRGPYSQVLDMVQSSLGDSLFAGRDVMRHPRVVFGGGSFEMELSRLIRDFSFTLYGREQLAYQAFADALEQVPAMLAKNSGMNDLDTLLDLRRLHAEGYGRSGIDTQRRAIIDVKESGILEPLDVKIQILETAAEAAASILRMNGLISR